MKWGILVEMDGWMGAEQLVSILEHNLLSSIEDYGICEEDIIIH